MLGELQWPLFRGFLRSGGTKTVDVCLQIGRRQKAHNKARNNVLFGTATRLVASGSGGGTSPSPPQKKAKKNQIYCHVPFDSVTNTMSEKAASPKPKTPKAKKPRTKKAAGSSTKGLYSKLVQEAIQAVGKPVKGASRQAIKQYIEEKHSKNLGKGWQARLKTVLRVLANSKKIVQTKGSFRVGKKEKKPAAKKAKKTKKTKKTTKKSTKKSTKKTRKSVKKTTKKAKATKAKKPRKAAAKKAKEASE